MGEINVGFSSCVLGELEEGGESAPLLAVALRHLPGMGTVIFKNIGEDHPCFECCLSEALICIYLGFLK